DEADRLDDRRLRGEAGLDRGPHEPLDPLLVEAELQLEEPRAGTNLLQGTLDTRFVGRRAGILDRSDEEMRRGLDSPAREVPAPGDRLRGRDQLRRVEIEDAPRLRLVAGRDIVAGEAADVLDPVERGADDVRLEREPIAIAADELHHRLHAELLQRDGDGEWRGVRVRGGVVGRVDRVDVVLVWLEALVDRVEPAGVDGQQLRSQDEAA